MQSLLEFILLRLIDHPEDLKITLVEEMGCSVYKIRLHPDDVGRVIGRGGNVIRAIRKLAQVRAVRDHIRMRVVIDEA